MTPIETIGQKVDPYLHQVIEVVSDSGEPETIVREELAGYLWDDRVLRVAKVVSVARNSKANES